MTRDPRFYRCIDEIETKRNGGFQLINFNFTLISSPWAQKWTWLTKIFLHAPKYKNIYKNNNIKIFLHPPYFNSQLITILCIHPSAYCHPSLFPLYSLLYFRQSFDNPCTHSPFYNLFLTILAPFHSLALLQ